MFAVLLVLCGAPAWAAGEITGVVVDDAGHGISGARVSIGAMPVPDCMRGTADCGRLSDATVVTARDGSFELSADRLLPMRVAQRPAQYLLVISNGPGYATLHRGVAWGGSTVVLGRMRLTSLTAHEQAMLRALNDDRGLYAYPRTAPVVIDEYAEEMARLWMHDIAAGKVAPDDPAAAFLSSYGAYPGAVMNGVGSVLEDNVERNASSSVFAAAEGFFSEKGHCPNGDWRTCPWAEDTGHYINLARDSLAWAGLAESPTPIRGGPNDEGLAGWYPYGGICVFYGATARRAADVGR